MPSQDQIQNWLVEQIAELVVIDRGQIDIRAPFSSYGLSSKDAVLLSGDMEDWLDRRLSPTIVYEYPTIEALASHLSGDVGSNHNYISEEKVTSPIKAGEISDYEPAGNAKELDHALEELVADLEQLSDEEVEARLLAKLDSLDRD